MCEFFDVKKNARMYHTSLDELQQTFPCHAEGSQVSTNHQMQRNKVLLTSLHPVAHILLNMFWWKATDSILRFVAHHRYCIDNVVTTLNA